MNWITNITEREKEKDRIYKCEEERYKSVTATNHPSLRGKDHSRGGMIAAIHHSTTAF
jgi:hypothetical protein